MILEKITTARGTLFIYILTGSLWYLLTHFLPDNRWRDIFTIGLAFLFCGIFMWSLFSTLQRIYGDDGNLWKELAMTTLNVFLFLLTFSALYYEVGIVDTTGYGDFRPQGITRVFASLQALIGYLVLGLMASTSLSVVKWTANGSGKSRGKNDS